MARGKKQLWNLAEGKEQTVMELGRKETGPIREIGPGWGMGWWWWWRRGGPGKELGWRERWLCNLAGTGINTRRKERGTVKNLGMWKDEQLRNLAGTVPWN